MPTKEEINQKIDSLPETLREILYSPELLEKVEVITTAHHFSEEKMRLVAGVVLRLFTGYLHPEDLVKEITNRLQIDKRVAEGVAREIRIKILYPIADELNKTHGFHIEGAPTPVATPMIQSIQQTETTPAPPTAELPVISQTPAVAQEETILKPHVQKEEPPTEPLASPFVLHEHEDIQTARGTINYNESFARPSFHIPETHAEQYIEPAPTARLELGDQAGSEAYIEPKTAKIGREEAKIVHYSAPDAQADPFSKAPEPVIKSDRRPAPSSPKPSVPRNNVVNLKDLPK